METILSDLKLKPKDLSDTYFIFIHCSSFMLNHLNNSPLVLFFQAINPVDLSLKLFQNGTIVYSMRRHLVLNCEGDLPIFPFDSPMCSFNIESGEQLNFEEGQRKSLSKFLVFVMNIITRIVISLSL